MMDFSVVALQVLFGALGATARFAVMSVIQPGRWSWGLFIVNMAGSLFVGVAVGAFAAGSIDWSVAAWVLAFAAGFTTFSTLTLTAAQWAEQGKLWRGLWFTATHVVLGALLAGAGYISATALLAA